MSTTTPSASTAPASSTTSATRPCSSVCSRPIQNQPLAQADRIGPYGDSYHVPDLAEPYPAGRGTSCKQYIASDASALSVKSFYGIQVENEEREHSVFVRYCLFYRLQPYGDGIRW